LKAERSGLPASLTGGARAGGELTHRRAGEIEEWAGLDWTRDPTTARTRTAPRESGRLWTGAEELAGGGLWAVGPPGGSRGEVR